MNKIAWTSVLAILIVIFLGATLENNRTPTQTIIFEYGTGKYQDRDYPEFAGYLYASGVFVQSPEAESYQTPSQEIKVTSQDILNALKSSYYTNDPERIRRDYKDILSQIDSGIISDFLPISSNENCFIGPDLESNTPQVYLAIRNSSKSIIGFKKLGP